MKKYTKKDFPVSDIRHFLEPGPIVLITSATALNNIQTLHYRGKGVFITSGKSVNKRQKFAKWKDTPNF